MSAAGALFNTTIVHVLSAARGALAVGSHFADGDAIAASEKHADLRDPSTLKSRRQSAMNVCELSAAAVARMTPVDLATLDHPPRQSDRVF
jgi:hypothetical protein